MAIELKIDIYSQRISAAEHLDHLNLRGFGISIIGNKDVDQNFYNDILVGSYLSNKAVLLRFDYLMTRFSLIYCSTSLEQSQW